MEQGVLKGKAAIVTGSSSGIGQAAAIGLAQRGAGVIVNYAKSAAEAQETAEAIRKGGGKVRVVQADVANDSDCRKLAAAAMDEFGRMDILVNNAGTTKFAAHTDLDALSAEDFAGIYATNVIGAFQMVRACLPALKKSGDSAVVNVSSIAALTGIGSSIAYAASKGAMNTLTLSLARALAPEVRVNAVCPGYVATPWFSKRFGNDVANRLAAEQAEATPLKRVADAKAVADTILYLAGPESRLTTGETILVDGGLHLTIAGTRRPSQ